MTKINPPNYSRSIEQETEEFIQLIEEYAEYTERIFKRNCLAAAILIVLIFLTCTFS